MNDGHCLAVRVVSILAAFQHAGVTALEAKGEDIEGDVGACLIDHADNPEGHAHALQTQTVGQCLLLGDMT